MLSLLVMDVVRMYFKKAWPHLRAVNEILDSLFKLTGEFNFPTLFSSLILLLAGFFLFLIYLTTEVKKYKPYWITLGIIFLFLACDESFKIHEGLSQLIRNNYKVEGSIRYGTWVIPYLLFSFVLGLLYLRFILSLPQFTKILVIVSGSIYVGGAAGFELIEGYLHMKTGEESVIYKFFHWSQEILEMIGIILFNYALLDYLSLRKITLEITRNED